MFERIVVGYEGTEQSKDALALAIQLARAGGRRLDIVGVVDVPMYLPIGPEYAKALRREMHEALYAAHGPDDVLCVHHLAVGSPARRLLEWTERLGADLIVVGSSERGAAGRTVAGHVAEVLLHDASAAVAVAPRGYAERPHDLARIDVGFDGSPEARVAASAAGALADRAGATVRLVGVTDGYVVPNAVPTPMTGLAYSTELQGEALRKLMTAAQDRMPEGVKCAQDLRRGRAAEALGEASEDSELLIVGSRNYGPLRRVLLGSTSIRLLRGAPVPTLVIPRGAEELLEPELGTELAGSELG